MSAKNKKKERKEKKLNESDSERVERWAKETQFNLSKPFGPDIGFFKAPPEVLNKMMEITDKILEDEDRVDWGKNLVGNIKEEPWVSNDQLKEAGVYHFFQAMIYNYVWNSLTRSGFELEKLEVNLDHMWVVSQYAGEYNPIHYHTYCDLSSVMWLNIPEMEDRRESKKLPAYKRQNDGFIEFVYKTACPSGLERGTLSFLPEEGQMAIFPSNLLHTVYPFEGLGERRSVAFNSHWNAILKNGKMFDKAMRPPSDQNNEQYRESLSSKKEESGFAKRKQGSLDSGDSEAKDES
jgi:uncharacterized protein (TIGR02466 family)